MSDVARALLLPTTRELRGRKIEEWKKECRSHV